MGWGGGWGGGEGGRGGRFGRWEMGRWEVGGGRVEISMLYFEHGCCSACSPSAYMSTNKGVPHGTLLLFFFFFWFLKVCCNMCIQHKTCYSTSKLYFEHS